MNPKNSIILCVDDQEANLKLLENILAPRGYGVVKAVGGKEALLKIKSQTIDLVILDILMPEMDGFEVCRQIKEDQKLRNIPVIMITALTAKQDRIRGIEAGAEEFLSKPFDQTEALARIKLLLKLKELDDDRERAEEALKKSHAELDCQVRERTADLAHANELLLSDIAERERLMAAIEQAGEIFIITDHQGNIQYVNPAFETVTGYTRKEAIGRNPRFLKSGEHDRMFYRELWQTISAGKKWHGTMLNKRKNGKQYTEEATISPVCDDGGRIVSYIAVKRDITAQRLIEEQLRQAQKMEIVGQLAGGVAHDFNNMLQVIISYVEMSISKVDAAQPLYQYLMEIRRAAHRSAEMTGQLLAFARKQTVSPKVLDLNDAVVNSQKMVQRLIGEDIDLAWMPGHDLWKLKIDPGQLDQILANLAVNARDAIGGVGKLTIGTGKGSFDEAYCSAHLGCVPGEYLLLAVSDDGCGMDRETMSHIFEPFFTTKGPGKGTGLGLATIYGIVKQNNGFIDVYSEPGHGTTFKVYLPRAEGAEAAEGQEAEPTALREGTETVLVVEDEAAILVLARESLELLGYSVLTANSPEEALRRSDEHAGPIHLIITDVVMPQMNGRQLAERLCAVRPGLKCLFMSGYTADIIAHRGVLDEGMNFIGKPFSLTTLAGKVREVLDE